MSRFADLKATARIGVDAAVWRAANGAFLLGNLVDSERNSRAGFTDEEHLLAAAAWLGRAQDASGDGGVAGRYLLHRGWTSSYPETTGYIIPTFLRLAELSGAEEYHDRARRCVNFLLGVQLESGAFPGMEIAENRTNPSVFNTAQIVTGLRAWHEASRDEKALAAARRACDWLVAQQDEDGAWRKHLYGGETYTYMAHAGCWVAEMGAYLGERAYLESARAHLEWVLAHYNTETGWFDKSGFSIAKHHRGAVTHTVAYTIWGVLMMARILEHPEGIAAARHAALQAARRLELSRWLPGVLDAGWRGQSDYSCPTGNAQLALVWLELHRLQYDPTLVSAACKVLDLVKQIQPMRSSNPGIRGGIPGSSPIWGGYVYMSLPNWAAKFFIDALMAKCEALTALRVPPAARPAPPDDIHGTIPPFVAPPADPQPRVVLLASPDSHKVQQMVRAWSSWGFTPDCVVISHSPSPPPLSRVWSRIRRQGFRWILGRATGRKSASGPSVRQPVYVPPGEPVDRYCRRMGIRCIEVGKLDSPGAVAAVEAEHPDLLVYAGGGILRKAILDIPRIGTLNAHMGLLPRFRGMNVAEWSRWYGAPTGCTVHLVDAGIDTGEIVCARAVSTAEARSIGELRQSLDTAQIELLGETVRYVLSSGRLPARRAQQESEGRQYFAMHPEIRLLLERSLERR